MLALDNSGTMVIAHAGHWLLDSVVLLPVLLFGVWLAVTAIRDRRN